MKQQQYCYFPAWDLLQVGLVLGLGEPVLQHRSILSVGGEEEEEEEDREEGGGGGGHLIVAWIGNRLLNIH